MTSAPRPGQVQLPEHSAREPERQGLSPRPGDHSPGHHLLPSAEFSPPDQQPTGHRGAAWPTEQRQPLLPSAFCFQTTLTPLTVAGLRGMPLTVAPEGLDCQSAVLSGSICLDRQSTPSPQLHRAMGLLQVGWAFNQFPELSHLTKPKGLK